MDAVTFAHENGLQATKALSRSDQKSLGQFMTPPAIAQVMAARACTPLYGKESINILDPAAGSGVLAAAAVLDLLGQTDLPRQISVELFELDSRLRPTLELLANQLYQECRRLEVELRIKIRTEDFLLSDVACDELKFDLVIANPPYFKLSRKDQRVERHSYAVHGQPNIYGLFMAACSRVLASGGRWCFITPRSWTNGPYFTLMRRCLLQNVRIDAIHTFESRRDHFTDDEVLQETMITWATAQPGMADTISLSTSRGVRDIDGALVQTLPTSEVIHQNMGSTISLPTGFVEDESTFFKATLDTYGLKVSTGPVVAFRASDHLSGSAHDSCVPLLWMQHIQHMRVHWPIRKKREYIAANGETAWMLVHNANMVILRRFSPKEAVRRVTAAPYMVDSVPGTMIGLENHTNFIHRPGGQMSEDEVKGLAAFLNSAYVDRYFSRTSGNTQVNASDLRRLPLPPLNMLIEAGRKLPKHSTLKEADLVMEGAFNIRSEAALA